MFKMSCRLVIHSPHSPAILLHIYVANTHCYHRFDCNAKPIFQHHATTRSTIVWDWWIFVHLFSNTMPYKLADYTIAIRLTMILNSITYISYPFTGDSLFYPKIKRLLGDIQELFDFRCDLTNTKGVSRVTTETIEQGTAINRNYIAIFQKNFVRWNAVHHYIIDRRTYRTRKRNSILIRISLECRDCSVIAYKFLSNGVKLLGRDTRLYIFCYFRQCLTYQVIACTQELYFVVCF